ncbi:MAG: S41 family peptidase [Chitinophagaceae bacterium]|nr:S41 family peptidase [Chitinophagaceae bacterium]
MNNKKLQVWLPLLLSIMMIFGMLIGFKIKGNMPGNNIFYNEKQRPVQEVLNLIKDKYVDDIETDSLADSAIVYILSKLDPHSLFMPAKELQQVKEELEGQFYGIGIEYGMINDTINVLNVIKDGPSEKAGLIMGDKFLKVGDSSAILKGIKPDKIKQLFRGGNSSKVVVTILRNNEIKQITIVRGMIPIYSLDAAYMVSDSIGYIRLNKFSEVTYKEFMRATETLQKQGMKSMILDLRDNGGGVLSEATNIADEFLDGDKLITYTEGKHSPKKEYRCQKEGIFEKGKLAILSNEGTASASEVLIGALQDWDRATIIGRRTFGKGLVQEQFELSDGSGLRLTIARYYTPLGRSIQKSYSKGVAAYESELLNRFHDGEVFYADSTKSDTTKLFKTKSGKIVYGGGGITPDVFVALDTTAMDKELSKIYQKGTINNFIYKNYMSHQSNFAAYKTPLEFQKSFLGDGDTWNSFIEYASKDSVNLSNISQREKTNILNQIKILTARQIWHTEGLYEVSNAADPLIKKALEVLHSEK